ncbi:hypothetical protein [Streptomyces mayteni]
MQTRAWPQADVGAVRDDVLGQQRVFLRAVVAAIQQHPIETGLLGHGQQREGAGNEEAGNHGSGLL